MIISDSWPEPSHMLATGRFTVEDIQELLDCIKTDQELQADFSYFHSGVDWSILDAIKSTRKPVSRKQARYDKQWFYYHGKKPTRKMRKVWMRKRQRAIQQAKRQNRWWA
jgi:hypothetical protein